MVTIPHGEPVDDIYFRPYAYLDWDPNDVQSYLNLLQPNSCYYILQAKDNA